jgi:hypothetical protein
MNKTVLTEYFTDSNNNMPIHQLSSDSCPAPCKMLFHLGVEMPKFPSTCLLGTYCARSYWLEGVYYSPLSERKGMEEYIV